MNNTNFPKCINCIQNNCTAGEVNHDSRNGIPRTNCLFDCGCKSFQKAENFYEIIELSKTDLKEL